MQIGDKISIFSDKAYRKNQGKYFEAVGNVVIISQKDTIYGELASLDQEKMMVKIEGNVRIITKDMTLYGSHLEYNIITGVAVIKNARILTAEFNLVANELMRVSDKDFLAKDGEFTTCKDCAESWSVFGKTIRMRTNEYVQIRHALMKVKGANVLYVPYISIPIMVKRKTGMLFPEISSRVPEGISFEQPVFVAMGDNKDATISPMFWSKRGYGGNFQYRQRFRDLSWLEFNARTLQDQIYLPGKSSLDPSGKDYFRYYMEAESHQQWSSDLKSHFRYTGVKDLDMSRIDPIFIQPRTLSTDYGFQGHGDFRQDHFSVTAEADYLRNQLVADPTVFDRSYVQVMPRIALSSTPYTLMQSNAPMFQHIAVGMDSSYTRFRQVDQKDPLRNADRETIRPYLMWHFLTLGPVSLKSRYTLDQQVYQFSNSQEPSAGKNAGLMQTEVAFTMDKIFGLAFEEKIPVQMISKKDLKRLREQKEQGLAPIQKTEKVNPLVGELEPFEAELVKENIVQMRNSYRHSQEFKFIHHYITSQSQYGNKNFLHNVNLPPINNTNSGQVYWFDYEDAIRKNENLYGASATRNLIPPQNTVEFQWNNSLIRKTPKPFSYLEDDKYLRDNFNYTRTGYFNVSQGYLLNENQNADLSQRLTRLLLLTGYNADKWSANLSESYFFSSQSQITTVSATRRFEYLNIFSGYNSNYNPTSKLNTLSFGGQVRPTDVLGFAIVKNNDLRARREISSVYSLDIMPNNNCWILNLNYRQSNQGNRYSFNIFFNFGDDKFDRYRDDYFAVKRL
jgi:LPS-assembly protein